MTAADLVVTLAAATGHAALSVLVVNVVHGSGLPERTLGRVNKALFFGSLAVGLAILAAGWLWPWRDWPWPLRIYGAASAAVALVGLPLSTLSNRLRPAPAEARLVSSEQLDPARGSDPHAWVGPGKRAWLLRLPGNESLRLEKAEWELAPPGLPAALDGLSVVQVTDLHLAPSYDRGYFEAVLDEAAGWEADLVLVTGDLVDHDDAIAWIEPLLGRLRARVGKFSILGNHDYIHDPLGVRRALADAGFEDLEARWARLDLPGATLALGGTSYPWGPVPIPDGVPADADFRLLMSHSPDLLYRAADAGVDLVLSGHNHGGQVRLPLLGPVFMPSVYSRRLDRGPFRHGRTLLYVGKGIGGKHPIRYNCPPEITRLVLRVPTPAPGRLAASATATDPEHSPRG